MPGYPIPQSGGEPQGGSPFPMASGPKAGGKITISRAEAVALRAYETDEDEERATKRARQESGLSPDQLKVLRSRADRARGGGYSLEGPGIVFKPKPGDDGDEPGLLGRSDLDDKSKDRVKDEARGFSKQSDRDDKISKGYAKTAAGGKVVISSQKKAPVKVSDGRRTRESHLRECAGDTQCTSCAKRAKTREAIRRRFRERLGR